MTDSLFSYYSMGSLKLIRSFTNVIEILWMSSRLLDRNFEIKDFGRFMVFSYHFMLNQPMFTTQTASDIYINT